MKSSKKTKCGSRKKYVKAMHYDFKLPSVVYKGTEWFIDKEKKHFKRLSFKRGIGAYVLIKRFDSYIGREILDKVKE